MGDIDKRKLAAHFTESLNPNELPMTKQSLLAPFTAMESILRERASEERAFPSIQSAISGAFPTAAKIFSPSV